MLECLDIGASSTLAGLDKTDEAVMFGAAQSCGSKTVSDGIISAHDFGVMMWAQFRVAPYDRLDTDKSELRTVHRRARTFESCAANTTRQDHQLQLAQPETFCLAGTAEAAS